VTTDHGNPATTNATTPLYADNSGEKISQMDMVQNDDNFNMKWKRRNVLQSMTHRKGFGPVAEGPKG